MNIQLPYSWIKEYLKTDLKPQEFADLMPLHGPQVEKWWRDEKLNDEIFDIEITPNRVDTASVLGIAREAGAINRDEFTYPKPSVKFLDRNEIDLKVQIVEGDLCRRFCAIVIDGVKVGESPEWLKKRLEALGKNSINNLVDISNYVLLEYGYPTHIFDYDKLSGSMLQIRRATKGEKLVTLDDEEKSLTSDDLVIADSEKPVSLAGIKGGKSTGVDSNTKTVVLEAANFEPYNIRKTARRHELHTDAASLFEKGLSPNSPSVVIQRVAELVLEIAGGEVKSELIDEKVREFGLNMIIFEIAKVEKLLGHSISKDEIVDILSRLEFECNELSDGVLEVTVPHFRTEDVEFDYDLVEEVARIYGYENIPTRMLDGEIPIVPEDDHLIWEDRVKDILSGVGLYESFSVSMVGDKQLEMIDLQPDQTIQVTNPLVEDYKYMRTELTSSMITAAIENEDYANELSLFELNMIYIPRGEKELPIEQSSLSILTNGISAEDTFLKAKGYWEYLLRKLGISLDVFSYENSKQSPALSKINSVSILADSVKIGELGLISENLVQKYNVKKYNCILEINFDHLLKMILQTTKSYKGIPLYPSSTRDLAFVFENDVTWQSIKKVVMGASEGGEILLENVELFDIYKGKNLGEGKKSVAFKLSFRSDVRTLQDEEIQSFTQKIISEVEGKLGGVLR